MNEQETFAALCRENGWKNTPQRFAVFRIVFGNHTHPSVDEVWKTARKTVHAISRESVYRILNELTAAGTICRLDHLESARYDGQTAAHGHFICAVCGTITDFPLSSEFQIPEELSEEEIRHFELRVSGICHKCKKTLSGKHSGTDQPK